MASVIDALLVYFCTAVFKNKWVIFGIGCVLYVLCLLSTSYSFFHVSLLEKLLYYTNKIFDDISVSFPVGIIYFSIGQLLAYTENGLKFKVKTQWILFAISFALFVAEVLVLDFCIPNFYPSHNTMIIMPVCVLFLFSASLNYTKQKNTKTIRNISIIIYCSHYTVLLISSLIFEKISGITPCGLTFICLSIILPICLALAYGIVKLSEKKKLKFLKYLY